MSENTAMEPADRQVTQYAAGQEIKVPSGLKPAAEVAPDVMLSAERLLQLATDGFAPHYRIDGGPPLFKLAEVKSWVGRNLTYHNPGVEMPVRFDITIAPTSPVDAPEEIRDIPGLVGVPLEFTPGVYFLVRDGRIVYVGQSTNPMGRLAQHVGNPYKNFDRVFMVPIPREHLTAVENALIRMLQPAYNYSQRRPEILHATGEHEANLDVLRQYWQQPLVVERMEP